MMRLSVVTTLYRSSPHLEEFHARISAAVANFTDDYEIIYVNDGSPDDSLEIALRFHKADDHVKVIDLSRNFGHHQAIMAGLGRAKGERVFLVDCDLEEDPALIEKFDGLMEEHGVDVVYGVQDARRDPLWNRMTSAMFYGLFNSLSSVRIPKNVLTVRLMSRRYVGALLQYREKIMVIAPLWEMTGFSQLAVAVEKSYKGSTSYNFSRKMSHVLRSITATSRKPLIYIAYLGLGLTVTCLFYILYILLGYLFFGYGIPGWSSVILSIWFFGGLNIFVTGIIAIYLSVIFAEVKDRPNVIVRGVYEHLRDEAPRGPAETRSVGEDAG